MAITWNTPAGALVPTVTERVTLNISIQASSDVGPITFTLIAGKLPRGLRLDGNIEWYGSSTTTGHIKGSPTEVRQFTLSRFVIRADDGIDIEDRTFSISVDGADNPQWVTKEGFLNVGAGKDYFVLDNAYVNFQLEAYDPDTLVGEKLEYFLMPTGGELPPGLSLSSDGVISGFTDPIFALEYSTVDTGAYDTGSFDTAPLDYGKNSSQGYDSYTYDQFDFDYSETPIVPRRLSRVYTFVVGVSDGFSVETRIFKIYVVTEEFLKADNTLVQVDTNLFTADNTNNRIPIWITESNLGRVRANNYVTIFLDVYDPPTLPGSITYFLLDTNPGVYRLNSTGEVISNGAWEITGDYPFFPVSNIKVTSVDQFTVISPETPSRIPPGLVLDTTTGELAGRVPYQDRVSKVYTWTMRAVDFPTTLADEEYTLVGDWNSSTAFKINQVVRYKGLIYICIKDNKNKVPTESLDFWVPGVSTADKTFTLEVIGEIESGINWISNSNLGLLQPNKASMINLEAESLIYGGRVVYKLVSGTLPPGLGLLPNGLITGKVRQFWDGTNLGLTRFYDIVNGQKNFNVIFDINTTTFDRIYRFAVQASDTANASADIKEFYITITTDYAITFANLWVKSFQHQSKRIEWFDFISDTTIFKPENLYRYGDTNFGVQSEIKMLVYAGIESTTAVKYVQAMSRNHYRKRLLFGNVKSAKAKDPVTQETIYEVVYVEIVDEYEKNGKSISSVVEFKDTIKSKVLVSYDAITVDSDIPFASDRDHQRVFPNSIKNMRSRIDTVGERDRTFLPLWMRSIQDEADYELGYTKALVLCYAKPGKSAEIMSKIKASGFDFKMIDFEADRYVIDILDNEIQDKYLAFPQRGEKRP